MNELSSEYFRILAEQLVFISAFLGGFSATLLGTIIVFNREGKIIKAMIISLALASTSFIVSVIACTKILMMLAPDSPLESSNELLLFPRVTSVLAFTIGIMSLLTVIGLAGWTKSKVLGITTTIISLISGGLIVALL